jgi:hypothetical protein
MDITWSIHCQYFLNESTSSVKWEKMEKLLEEALSNQIVFLFANMLHVLFQLQERSKNFQ